MYLYGVYQENPHCTLLLFILQIAKADDSGDVMQGCNDCTFDYNGNLWLTAPAGKIAPDPYLRSFGVSSTLSFTVQERGQVKIDMFFISYYIHFISRYLLNPNNLIVDKL